MNLADLPAALEKNKTAAYGVGGVAVVGFALYKRHKSAGATSTAGDAGAALSSGSQTAAMSGGTAYDSSASDFANAIQPQLDGIASRLDQLQSPASIPAPVPAPPHSTGLIPPAPVIAADPHLVWKPGTVPVRHPVTPPPSRTPRAPTAATYVVRPGDNLSKIAAMFPSRSITANSIYSANRQTIGSNKNLIKPGQKLVIR